jgi:hypothetical protein
MREQLVDRDFRGHLPVRVVGQVARDGVLERELAAFGQLRDGDAREHLVHRAEVELRVGAVGDPLLFVRHAVGFLEDGRAVAHDEHRAGERVGGDRPVDHALQLLELRRLVRRRGRRGIGRQH